MTLDDIFARCTRDETTGCLLWTGPLFDGKYGGIYDENGVRHYIHRYVEEQTRGELLLGQVVRHTCDTHLCCEPTHLKRGTHRDNMEDMARRGRSRSRYSPDLIRAVRRINTRGFSQSQISRVLQIPQTTVSGICRGARWSLLDAEETN